MKTIIQFMVTKDQGVYTADGVNVPVVSEGSTFEELQTNIREAVILYFEGDMPPLSASAPRRPFLPNFELSPALYEGPVYPASAARSFPNPRSRQPRQLGQTCSAALQFIPDYARSLR